MISVISDDLSGATEIAGLAWRFGLKTEILLQGPKPRRPNADLVILDTNSRLCNLTQAVRRTIKAARLLKSWNPDWIYKKVDSVLRGHILLEIQAITEELGLKSSLLVPANPSAGRVIRNGRYFINGIPINRTDFRNDPAHPRRSSMVKRMLHSSKARLTILHPGKTQLPPGLALGEAAEQCHLDHWASLASPEVLPAGAADFFRALLQKERIGRERSGDRTAPLPRPKTTLFVSGSIAASALEFTEQCRSRGWPVLPIPSECHRRAQQAWVSAASDALKQSRSVWVGIGLPQGSKKEGEKLSRILVNVACQVIKKSRPSRVFIEGGATAAALLRELGYQHLAVIGEFGAGTTAVCPAGQKASHIIIKPGSYRWPVALLS